MAENATLVALEKLKRGNSRFLDRAGVNEARRKQLASGQQPHVAILGCADSRTAPEIVFDAGLGELFVVRVAGNVANTASIASIEYAVSQLGTRLVVVLAHESCGAVGAALAGGDAGKNLNRLLEHITPAVEASGDSDVNVVARHSARWNAARLTSESAILRDAVSHDGLRIVTAFHHFTTGAVEFD
jgi:carbonic anhydrase